MATECEILRRACRLATTEQFEILEQDLEDQQNSAKKWIPNGFTASTTIFTATCAMPAIVPSCSTPYRKTRPWLTVSVFLV